MTKRTTSPGAGPFNDAFRGLAERLGAQPVATPASVAAESGARVASGVPPARAVVRLERKGRGGKEATVIEKLGLAPERRAAWLKDLKRALGCGGVVEGEALVLQGDLRHRVKALLEERGVRKVTLG